MPLTFLAGNAPDYAGSIFQSSTSLIDQVQQTLTTAGWTTYFKAGDGLTLVMVGTSTNSHTCTVEFKITTYGVVTNGRYLVIRGWHEPTRVTGSPDNFHRLIFVDGRVNRLWLTADEDSGAICIFGAEGSCTGWHFGFLNRIEPTDQWAWMIGQISSSSYSAAYVARSKFNNTNWRLLSTDFHTNAGAPNFDQQYSCWPFTTLDFTMRGASTDVNILGINASGSSNNNAFYNYWQGRLNYDNRAVIDPYCYLEGRGGSAVYTIGNYDPLYFRGYVKHCFCGVASLPAAAQTTYIYTDPVTYEQSTQRILSVGGGWWQGMRIQ